MARPKLDMLVGAIVIVVTLLSWAAKEMRNPLHVETHGCGWVPNEYNVPIIVRLI